METALTPLIAKLVEFGPGFIFAGIFLTLYLIERKKSENLATKLYDLGLESLKADLEHSKAYTAMEKTLDLLARTLTKDPPHGPYR